MTDQYITYELEGDIALIGINRPDKRNAMSREVTDELVAAAQRAGREARAGIIFGHGDHFCAGLDLVAVGKKRKEGVSDTEKRERHPEHLGFDAIARGPIPFVAALSGAVIGLGLELACAAQIRVADTSAVFGLPEAMRGIFVGGGGSVRIQRLIGYARMADMMLTRRTLSAEESHAQNLCQYVVAPGEALTKARELAARMVENVALSNWTICNILPRINDLSHDDGLVMEQLAAHYTVGQETLERLEQFAAKRGPRFL